MGLLLRNVPREVCLATGCAAHAGRSAFPPPSEHAWSLGEGRGAHWPEDSAGGESHLGDGFGDYGLY